MASNSLPAPVRAANPKAPGATFASRRSVLGGAFGLTAALAVPATSTASGDTTPFRAAQTRYRAAGARFNGLPRRLEETEPAAYRREELAYFAAVRAVDEAPVASWAEFADAFEIACDSGESIPNEDLISKLLSDVRRLSRGA